MTTSGISQTGIQSNLINQQMNELKKQNQFNPDKDKDDAIRGSDTVQVTGNILDSARTKTRIFCSDQGRRKF